MDFFKIDSVNCIDYCTHVLDVTYEQAEKNIEEIEIDGRNGTLLIDDGTFKNNKIVYDCITIADETKTKKARYWHDSLVSQLFGLSGYNKLNDSIRDGEYRYAYLNKVSDVKVTGNKFVKFKLEFIAKPQRYLNDGNKTITVGRPFTNFANPTPFTAKPLFKISASNSSDLRGQIRIQVNGGATKLIGFDASNQPYSEIYIDCESMTIQTPHGFDRMKYFELVNGSFFEFPKGTTAVSYEGNKNIKVKVEPRWWTV